MKRTKKLLSLLLTFALVLTIAPWSWISVSAYDEPTLNDEGYYELSMADHLYWFAEQVNSGNNAINGVLLNDIVVNEGDLSGYDGVSENNWKEWTPIGNDVSFYMGTFDGAGHSVSGLYLDTATADFIGFFGVVAGTVKNIGIENSYFKGNMAVGGICSYIYNGTVEKSYSSSAVEGVTYVGGICGFNAGIINSCYNMGSVFGEEGVGGICGYSQSTIKNSYNIGSVKGRKSVGGVCGYGLATNCYYLTNCANNESGIVQTQIGIEATEEQFASGEICYALNDGVSTGTQTWYQNVDNGEIVDETPQFLGGTVYYVCHKDLITNNYEESIHNYQDSYCSVCYAYQWTVTKDNYESLGLTEDYIGFEAIYNYNQLCLFANKVNGGKNAVNAVLMNDIVANDGDLSNYDGESENSWVEWTPIGTDNVVCYSGIFDGNGHTISGLYFNNPSINNVGLFGYVDKATIRNVGLISSYIEGKQYVGGICGYNHSGNIENCFNSSAIIGSRIVGGICGYHYYGMLASCYNVGTITGLSSSVGSICGEAEKTIENCYYLSNSATYNGTTQNGIGGTMDVYGKTMVATAEQFSSGEVAYLLNNGVTDGTQVWYQNIDNDGIKDAYPIFYGGTVFGNETCNATGVTVNYSNILNKSNHTYNDKGVCTICKKGTPAVLITRENYVELGVDWEHIGFYAIYNAGNLYWFANQFNKGDNKISGLLMKDIIVNEGDLSIYDGVSDNDWLEWIPVGDANNKYNGEFDGANHTISGLYFNDDSVDYVGLFGYIAEGATIINIGIEKSYLKGDYYVGGICGYFSGFWSEVYNCYNTSTISGNCYVGGVFGYIESDTNIPINNCYNTGNVNGDTYVGGVCGYNINDLEDCYNAGSVTGSSWYIGGVCGYNRGVSISKCYNAGEIEGYADVGGICGSMIISKLSNCYNVGGITSLFYAGGICGEIDDPQQSQVSGSSSINNCYNTGIITRTSVAAGNFVAGGIYGFKHDGTITNCYYLVTSVTDYYGGDTATAAQFASGEVAYLLNSGVTDGTQVWYQNIDKGETVDTSPKFTGETVYQYYNICPDEEVAYSNTENKKGQMHSFESGVCSECGVSFINPWKSQIRFDKNDDGTFAGTFDYRVLATITSDDLAALFDAGNSTVENEAVHAIVETGFVMTKGTDVSSFDYETAKNVVKGTSNAYTKVPVDWISTSFDSDPQSSGKGDYVISCIVEDIPEADKNMCLATMAYIVYNDSDGNLCYMFYPTIDSVCFEGLYEQYYSLAFPS